MANAKNKISPYQSDDDLAVTASGEGVLAGELLPDLGVVVNLSIGLKCKGTSV
jgi:hypothetical protein